MIASLTYRDELMLLAAEIYEQNPKLRAWDAFDEACRMLPGLLADVETRYRPCRVVLFDAAELWAFTGGDNER